MSACAPLLDGSVPLDFVSPLAQATTPCQAPFQPYAPEQIKEVSNALQDALTRSASIKPAAQIVTRFTKVIVLRKDRPAGHSSDLPKPAGEVAALTYPLAPELGETRS